MGLLNLFSFYLCGLLSWLFLLFRNRSFFLKLFIFSLKKMLNYMGNLFKCLLYTLFTLYYFFVGLDSWALDAKWRIKRLDTFFLIQIFLSRSFNLIFVRSWKLNKLLRKSFYIRWRVEAGVINNFSLGIDFSTCLSFYQCLFICSQR